MDMDVYLLSTPPPMRVKVYCKRMLAYSNHYRVRDADTPYKMTYDCGLICVFKHDTIDKEPGYVGELVDIWVLDYGSISLHVILMRADWVQQE